MPGTMRGNGPRRTDPAVTEALVMPSGSHGEGAYARHGVSQLNPAELFKRLPA